jgi:hypothetical protein
MDDIEFQLMIGGIGDLVTETIVRLTPQQKKVLAETLLTLAAQAEG